MKTGRMSKMVSPFVSSKAMMAKWSQQNGSRTKGVVGIIAGQLNHGGERTSEWVVGGKVEMAGTTG